MVLGPATNSARLMSLKDTMKATIAPEKMLSNFAAGTNAATNYVMNWVGVGLFSIGCMNFLSRNDPGSQALRAVMIGNIVLHVVGLGFDVYDYSIAFMRMPGLIMGIVVHTLLVVGFAYYLTKVPKTV